MTVFTKKRCNKCNELKIVTEFEEKGLKKGVMQYGPTCKDCLGKKFNMPSAGATLDIRQMERIADETSITSNGTKVCRICGKAKPLDEFYKDRVSNGIQRYRNDCKSCSIEQSKVRTKKYNEAKSNLVNDLTEEQWQESCTFFGNHCAYCGTGPVQEKEHIVPVSQGGGFTKSNIIPACKRCNASKGGQQLVTWYPQMPWFSPERLQKILIWVKNNK